MCLEFHKRTINYIGCYAFDILLQQFYKKKKNCKLHKVSQREHASRWCCIVLYSRHKKCSTRQTITVIDGRTAVNYVTNNFFLHRRLLAMTWTQNWSNTNVFRWKEEKSIDLLKKPEHGDDFKIREKSQINVHSTSWGLPLSMKKTGNFFCHCLWDYR